LIHKFDYGLPNLSLYTGIVLIASIILTALGVKPFSTISASAAITGNVGPSFGIVDPISSFIEIPDSGKWVLGKAENMDQPHGMKRALKKGLHLRSSEAVTALGYEKRLVWIVIFGRRKGQNLLTKKWLSHSSLSLSTIRSSKGSFASK
jgi:hypothetical protein